MKFGNKLLCSIAMSLVPQYTSFQSSAFVRHVGTNNQSIRHTTALGAKGGYLNVIPLGVGSAIPDTVLTNVDLVSE
jgi:hypothetical protein